MALLEIEKLQKRFGGLYAVKEVDLSVEEGEILGVIGPNGSGKTTFFNLISGMLQPNGGKIIFRGRDITAKRPHIINQLGIARTFQIVRPFKEMTVLRNVMVGRAYGHRPARTMQAIRSEAEELLRRTGLWEKRSITAEKLPLIDRKRLELNRALATEPKLLLLDEVMAGLNTAEIEEAMQLVRDIRESGVTLIIVEHVMKALLAVSDRVVALNLGEKIAEGTPREIVENQEVRRVYLGDATYA
jgi:branched-chain amino acid transport system ATP-binding protein